MYKVKAKNREHLKQLIAEAIQEKGPECSLNFIDVSSVSDMHYMFHNSQFNGDISEWNVSSVRNMRGMFAYSSFNGDISEWDVSSVRDMRGMFDDSQFNGDISEWDVSRVRDMNHMFSASQVQRRHFKLGRFQCD